MKCCIMVAVLALCFGVRMENLDFTRVFDLHGIFPIKRIEEKLKFTI